MAYNEDPRIRTHSEQQKPFLMFSMVWVGHEPRIFIEEDGLSFFKGNSMLAFVCLGLFGVPLESQMHITL